MAVAVLQKAMQAAKAQGQAEIALIRRSGEVAAAASEPGKGSRVDVVA